MSTEPGFVETKKYCADSLPLGALRRYLSSTLARGLAVVPVAIALGAIITAGCESHPGGGEPDALVAPDAQGPDGQAQPDGGTPDAEAPGPDVWTAPSCEFTYEEEFVYPSPAPAPGNAQSGDLHGQTAPAGETSPRPSAILGAKDGAGVGVVAHQEPLPETYWLARSAGHGLRKDAGDIVMPGYTDNMPLFARAAAWDTATRCYELPDVAVLLTEDEAFELYRRIGELTTGVTWNLTPGRRNVLGLRGAYPGSFRWHGNLVNRFNDTLVLLWIDELGVRHVREFPVNTDTGAHDFGVDSSSSLRPNRRYRYANGWHRTYNALHIAESDYQVRDDGNKNGHWDSDRNGWWPPTTGTDRDRTGGGHNIHMGSVDAPLGTAVVGVWSAGCQVIPGMANWTEFITNAWTELDDSVDYYLVDARDIDPRVWAPCTPDGTHSCPFLIEAFPFTHQGDTSLSSERRDGIYNCSSADEGGPEVVYLFTVDRSGTVTVSVEAGPEDQVDPDVHLLDANDANSCVSRAHISLSQWIPPGRYFVVVDTFVAEGQELSGPYTLTVSFQ